MGFRESHVILFSFLFLFLSVWIPKFFFPFVVFCRWRQKEERKGAIMDCKGSQVFFSPAKNSRDELWRFFTFFPEAKTEPARAWSFKLGKKFGKKPVSHINIRKDIRTVWGGERKKKFSVWISPTLRKKISWCSFTFRFLLQNFTQRSLLSWKKIVKDTFKKFYRWRYKLCNFFLGSFVGCCSRQSHL